MNFEIEPVGRFSLFGDSNFIFRAIVGAISFYEGSEAVENLINEAVNNNSCALTNPLPEIEGKLLVPVGKNFFSKIEHDEKKKIKKMAYVEITSARAGIDFSGSFYAADGDLQLYLITQEKIEEKGSPHLVTKSTPHNTVPRLLEKKDGKNTEIYFERDAFYSDIRFRIFVYGSQEFKNSVKKGLQLIEKYGGFGHGRTSGRGMIRLKENEREDLPIQRKDEGLLISTLLPRVEEVKSIDWERSRISFELCRTVSMKGRFRESALMISAGSRICAHGDLPIGEIKHINNGDAQEKGVYFGRAIYV